MRDDQKTLLLSRIGIMLDGNWCSSGHRKIAADLKAKDARTPAEDDAMEISQAKVTVLEVCQSLLESDEQGDQYEPNRKRLKDTIQRELQHTISSETDNTYNQKPLFMINSARIRGSDFWRKNVGETYSSTYDVVNETLVLFDLPDCAQVLHALTLDNRACEEILNDSSNVRNREML